MYPRMLHKGPVTDRQTKRVENEDEHKAANKAGWNDQPSSWADEKAEDDADDAGADDKRKVPAVKEPKVGKVKAGK